MLDGHCVAVGRDPHTVTRSQVTWISVDEDPTRVVRWPDLHIVAGTSDEVAAEIRAFAAAGVQHFQVRFMDYPSTGGLERFVTKVLATPRRLNRHAEWTGIPSLPFGEPAETRALRLCLARRRR